MDKQKRLGKMAKAEKVKEITDKNFEAVLRNKAVVVDFFAEWCMPCLMLSPIIEELASKHKEIVFVKLNVDENKKIATQFKIFSIPTLLFFKQGKLVERVTGAQPYDVLEEKLKKLV